MLSLECRFKNLATMRNSRTLFIKTTNVTMQSFSLIIKSVKVNFYMFFSINYSQLFKNVILKRKYVNIVSTTSKTAIQKYRINIYIYIISCFSRRITLFFSFNISKNTFYKNLLDNWNLVITVRQQNIPKNGISRRQPHHHFIKLKVLENLLI